MPPIPAFQLPAGSAQPREVSPWSSPASHQLSAEPEPAQITLASPQCSAVRACLAATGCRKSAERLFGARRKTRASSGYFCWIFHCFLCCLRQDDRGAFANGNFAPSQKRSCTHGCSGEEPPTRSFPPSSYFSLPAAGVTRTVLGDRDHFPPGRVITRSCSCCRRARGLTAARRTGFATALTTLPGLCLSTRRTRRCPSPQRRGRSLGQLPETCRQL